MKILQLVSSLGVGGAEKFVFDLSVQLSKSGENVYILPLDHAADVGKCSEYEKRLIEQLELNGVNVLKPNVKGRKNVLLVLYNLYKVVSSIKPDIVHSHLFIWSFILSLLPIKTPHIFTQHTGRLKFSFVHKYWLKKRITTYIAISSATENSIIESVGNNNKRIELIYNGVDLESFKNINRINKKTHVASDTTFLMISRLTNVKNHDLVIKSADIIRRRGYQNFKVIIVGEGEEYVRLLSLVDDFSLHSHIQFVGVKSNVSPYYHYTNVYLLPSKMEGLSISLIEALATGINIIATDVGGNKEILDDGKLGMLISPNSLDELVSAMIFYINSDFSKNIVNENHLSKFTINSSCYSHLKLYKNILNEKNN